jgi:sugar phosphate isomerase/epimerase
MDDFGDDYFEEIKTYKNENNKWRKISEIAGNYGFAGIQINPTLYKDKLGLSLRTIPDFLRQFRLTYHMGGISTLINEDDYNKLNCNIAESLEISELYGIEDVSFHPPFINEETEIIRIKSKQYLEKLIEAWVPKFEHKNISLSLETHVSSKYFCFKGLQDYREFADRMKSLGVLIDISHNFYDKYSVDEIVNTLKGLKITGLHLSDAVTDMEFRNGTHLPVGKGNVDFRKIVQYFNSSPDVYGALEVKGSSEDIFNSVNILNSYSIKL